MNLPFCLCGCGNRVLKKGNRYINGHKMSIKKNVEKRISKYQYKIALVGYILGTVGG